jgi:hypothetical protein
LREVGATAEFFPAATPGKVAVGGNVTTTFTGTAISLACGRTYEVTGAYQLGAAARAAGTATTAFSTLPCASISPASITLKQFLGSAIAPVVFTTANFNGTPSFRITPSLPTGLSFNTATGAISGTPTVAKTDTRHTITAIGAVSGTATVTLNLTVAPALTDLEVLRYIASHPDLIDAFGTNIAKGRQHYLDWGFNEGRKITFEPLSYTASHGDLIGAFGTDETKAATHYIQWGFKEKRQISFNSLRYIASHPDLIEVFGADADKGVRHYINWGFKEGRKVTFDPLRYTASHPDLISAFAGDETKTTTHYIQAGYREKRQTTFSDLDALQFIASYADLITSLGSDVVAGIKNYVEKGYQAGRRILFDALTYIASHGDLIAAFGADAIAGVKHYINWGYKEGRKVVFDSLGYLAAHSDLRSAFGSDAAAATRHYINWGFKEGRTFLWTVSATAGVGGQVSAARSYVKTGDRVTITLTPQTGYAIDSATGCSGTLSGSTFTTGAISGTCEISAAFKPSSNLVISEVSNCRFPNLACWFEIYNRGAATVNLSNYQIRSTRVPRNDGTLDVGEFSLPSVTLNPGGYVIVSGNTGGISQRGVEKLLISSGALVPFWTQTNGFIEILASNVTIDFVLVGGTHTSRSVGQWSGAAIASSAINSESGYGKSVVRLFPQTSEIGTNSAAEWTNVEWMTPGGRNDVPASATDADNDGIPDTAEVSGGTFAGIGLHSLGARLNQRDIFIEVDFMDSTDAGVIPKREALQKVIDSFAAKNFKVHFDAGTTFSQVVSLSDFNLGQNRARVPYEKCVTFNSTTCVSNISFRRSIYDWKEEFMELRRLPVFHYMLFGSSQKNTGESGSSGFAEIFGNDLLITLGGYGLQDSVGRLRNILINWQAGTVMHELGHNLGLNHGGNDGTNDKPNYWSVMNYMYQLTGLDPDAKSGSAYLRWRYSKGDQTPSRCDLIAGPCGDPNQFVISFSDGISKDLDESVLLEKDNIGRGANAGAFADWNMDGMLSEASQSRDLNGDDQTSVLKDYNDWANLVLAFSKRFNGQAGSTADRISATTLPVDARLDPLSNDRQEAISCDPRGGRSLQ